MIKKNESFICINCGKRVLPAKKGKCRNHCNFCLYSRHMDISPGDRKHFCRGLMKPIKLEKRKNDLFIQHICLSCGIKRWNKICEDDILGSQTQFGIDSHEQDENKQGNIKTIQGHKT